MSRTIGRKTLDTRSLVGRMKAKTNGGARETVSQPRKNSGTAPVVQTRGGGSGLSSNSGGNGSQPPREEQPDEHVCACVLATGSASGTCPRSQAEKQV